MLRWLPLFALALLAAVTLSSSEKDAAAADVNQSCTARMAQTSNFGIHPNTWGLIAFMDYFQEGPLDQDREFTFTGSTPVIGVAGTAFADGTLSGIGFGNYAGFATTVEFNGNISFWDVDVKISPKLLFGTYTIGSDGNLPGGGTTEITTYCTFDPPAEIADPDDDGILSSLVVPGTINLSGTGALADGQNDLLIETDTGVQEITLADGSTITISFEKSGFAETIVERSFNRTRLEFVGTFNPGSTVDFDLPPELNDSVVQSDVTGGFTTFVKTDAAFSEILHDYSYSMGQGTAVDLLGGTESTGPWVWSTNVQDTVDSFNPFTGEFSGTAITEISTQNLYVDLFSVPFGLPGVQGDGLGGPLVFEEEIQGVVLANEPFFIDNCPDVANPDQADADGDGNGDVCDGVIWFDGNCSGQITGRDAVYTLHAAAGVALPAPSGCHQLGDTVGGELFGDWNCSTVVDGGDLLTWLFNFAGIDEEVPVGCPAPSTFIPDNG